MVRKIVALRREGAAPVNLAALFQSSLVTALMTMAMQLSENYNLERIVISGGCLQNRTLLTGMHKWFAERESSSRQLFSHRLLPTNDGGIALGQAVSVAARAALGTL